MTYTPVLRFPAAYREKLPDPRSLQKFVSRPPDSQGWSPHVLYRPHATNGQVIEGKFYWQKGGNRAVCITDMDGQHLNERIENCVFSARGNGQGRWILRDYETQGLVKGTIFQDVKEEHGRYTRLAPGVTRYENVLFLRCNSNAFQNRDEHEAANPHWLSERQLILHEVAAVECTTNRGTRPAFAFSPKSAGPNSDLIAEGLFAQTVGGPTFWYNGQQYNSFGGLCVELWRSVVLNNTMFELYRPRNTGIQLYDYSAGLVNDQGKLLPRRAPQFVDIDGGHLVGADICLRPEWHERVRINPGIKGDSRIKLFRWDKNPDGSPKLPSQGGTWRMYANLPMGPGYSQG